MTPEILRRELKKLDRGLDCTFNQRRQKWEVTGVDKRHKRYILYAFDPDNFSHYASQVIPALWRLSPTKNGGYKEVDRMLREEEERRERIEEEREAAERAAVTAESYGIFKRLIGETITLSDKGKQKDDEGVIIRDRRRYVVDNTSGDVKTDKEVQG